MVQREQSDSLLRRNQVNNAKQKVGSEIKSQLKGYELPDVAPRQEVSFKAEGNNMLQRHGDTRIHRDTSMKDERPQKRLRPYQSYSFKNDGEHKIVGRMRMASRQNGMREATPDQDDIRMNTNEEEEDVAEVVAAVIKRDQEVCAELKALRGDSMATHEGEDDENHKEEGGNYGLGVVDFGFNANQNVDIRELKKKRKKELRKAKQPPPVPSFAPGQLMHAGGVFKVAADRGVTGAGNDTLAKTTLCGVSFEALGVSDLLCVHLKSMGFHTPTDVQRAAIPPLLAMKDVLVNAPTGTGKTLSYLLPMLQNLALRTPKISRDQGTCALILAPTRELCLQVSDTLVLLTRRFVWLVPGTVHGGENRAKEKARLRKGITILAATPGRLLDHLENTSSFKIDQLEWLILDEADRLLDLGFGKKLEQIINILRSKQSSKVELTRCTALFSATLHGKNFEDLVHLSLDDPVRISVGDVNGTGNKEEVRGGSFAKDDKPQLIVPSQLKQEAVIVPMKLRLWALAELIKKVMYTNNRMQKLVIFFSTCDSVEFHYMLFKNAWSSITGLPLLPSSTDGLHRLRGTMNQADRTRTLLAFTAAKAGVLLCTDVAARGLDFPAVTHIVQYDPPGTAEEYVHRVGRTARLGQAGEALLFLSPSERGYVDYLKGKGLQISVRDEHLQSLGDLGKMRMVLLNTVGADGILFVLAEDAFRAYVRAYATHSVETKQWFAIKKLHLGHVADSFGLKERPKLLAKSGTKRLQQARKERIQKLKVKGIQKRGIRKMSNTNQKAQMYVSS